MIQHSNETLVHQKQIYGMRGQIIVRKENLTKEREKQNAALEKILLKGIL